MSTSRAVYYAPSKSSVVSCFLIPYRESAEHHFFHNRIRMSVAPAPNTLSVDITP